MCGTWYTWESLGFSNYVLLRRVGQYRHIGLTCVVVHMGVPWISYIEQWQDRHMGVIWLSYIQGWAL